MGACNGLLLYASVGSELVPCSIFIYHFAESHHILVGHFLEVPAEKTLVIFKERIFRRGIAQYSLINHGLPNLNRLVERGGGLRRIRVSSCV